MVGGGGGDGCASDGEMPSVWEYYLSDMGIFSKHQDLWKFH